ncbi:hypothetical protein V8C35DRAFT_318906 [Trichoderma chlorosporum]
MNLENQSTKGPQGQRFSRRPGLRNSMVPLHQRLLSKKIDEQKKSPLFSLLPTEIRAKIFTLALSLYEDTEAIYDTNSCYTQPQYFASRETSTSLLRTCRAVYRETWPLPVTLWEETVWIGHRLTAASGHPHSKREQELRQLLPTLAQQLGQEKVEIDSLHVFVQMSRLESGDLANLLSTPGLHPRQLTLTIHHTNCGYWPFNRPVCFTSKWIQGISSAISPSTNEFRIELETYERKKDQADAFGQQIAENWFFGRFGRFGETVLYADVSGKCHKVSQWTGSSKWHGRRWTQFDGSTSKVDYYALTITFETELALRKKGGVVSETAKRNASNPFHEPEPVNLGHSEDTRYEAWNDNSFDCVLWNAPLPGEFSDEDL